MGVIMRNFASSDVLTAVGASYATAIAESARADDAMRRHVAFRLRAFRGIRINDTGAIVRPDANGFIMLQSSDDSVTLTDNPKPHTIDFTDPTPEAP